MSYLQIWWWNKYLKNSLKMGIYEKTDWKDLPWLTILRYKKIYNIVFKYCFFIVIIILDIILFVHLSKNTIALNRVDKYPNERQKLLNSMNEEKNKTTNSDITAKIIQWKLWVDNAWNIFSANNLIIYKWFVMPRFFKINSTNNIVQKNKFWSWYDVADLEYFIDNIIFTDYKMDDDSSMESLLPLTDNLIENTFYISCLELNPNWLCRQFISNFVNSFYVYNLSTDYNWLKKVFNEIKETEFKSDFCEWLMKYVSYSHDTSADIEWIISQCDTDLYENFSSIKSFFSIQQQLDNWYIKSTLSTDKDVNTYKLLSYQQILYNNISQWVIDEAYFTTYLNFLSSLLKKDQSIDNIYYDITYRINNVYLIPTINTKKYKLTENKRNELDWIINNIYTINYWSKLEWHYWLESKLINQNLTTLWAESIDNSIIDREQDEMAQLLKWIKSLSYLKVTNDNIVWNVISIEWYLTLDWLENPLTTNIDFENKNWKLIVKKIWLENYKSLNDTINTLLERWNSTIIDIYEYLNKSIKLYTSNDLSTPCEIIESKISNIWTLSACQPDSISIKRNDWIIFRFVMSNYNIKKIIVSDKELDEKINQLIWNIYTNDITIPNIISNIINYNEVKWENKQEASLDMISTLQTINQYLWTEITDIQEYWDWNIYIEFSIWGIIFDGIFNPDSHTITSLNFHDNNININKFSLTLQNDHTNDINNFKSDPLKYLEQFDESAVNTYKSK